ncbi:MAG: hypothetical protein IPH31_24620 [Lewinellaceae bacterium]|nr:hypothetical protein [Lewinellaceae bacterium]
MKILNFITGYNLTLVEGQARVLRPGDEPETQIAEVYVPNIQLEVRQFGDGLVIALTKLIKELFRLHGKG